MPYDTQRVSTSNFLTFIPFRVSFMQQNEENLSTPRQEKIKSARFPRKDADKGWKAHFKKTDSEGQAPSYSSALEEMTFPLNSDLPSDLKIRKSSEFKEVFERGSSLHTENFTVMYNPNSLGFPRLGLVVGRKSSKSAVERNRIKRFFREVFRRNKTLFDSLDVVFLTKKRIETLSYKKAEEEIVDIVRSKLL